MELIRISNQKLKIMLTPSDMSHFELDSETLEDDHIQMHRAFRMLLTEVREQIGFEADDRHLSVQYFPSREGGCEMFISNLQDNDRGDGRIGKSTALQVRSTRKECFMRDFAYRFASLHDLLAVCKRLRSIGYICESAAYRDEEQTYHLFLSALSASPFSIPDELAFVVEYGTVENASARKLSLREHGRVICDNHAIEILSELA